MTAQWRLLTEFLRAADDNVTLTWAELDAIVGGLPASAVDHYPQWWRGDRPHTRAWRAAGFTTTRIEIGVAVTFGRMDSAARTTVEASGSRVATPNVASSATAQPVQDLRDLDPSRCLIVIPCSASKRRGGRPGTTASAAAGLTAARRRMLADPDSHTDESLVMPAWQRYLGHLYRAAGPVLSDLAATDRLLILSGGYGLLEGRDLIGYYDRVMRSGDWPSGLLERALADRAADSGFDVVAVAGLTTDYARALRRTPWRLRPERTAQLVTVQGLSGQTVVSSSLGLALRTFVERRSHYPQGTIVERLDA